MDGDKISNLLCRKTQDNFQFTDKIFSQHNITYFTNALNIGVDYSTVNFLTQQDGYQFVQIWIENNSLQAINIPASDEHWQKVLWKCAPLMYNQSGFQQCFNNVSDIKTFLVPDGMKVIVRDKSLEVILSKHVETRYCEFLANGYLVKVMHSTIESNNQDLLFQMYTVETNLPEINQINTISKVYARPQIDNLPLGLRNLVVSDSKQYAVAVATRGRQSFNVRSILNLVLQIRAEFGLSIVDIVFENLYTGTTALYIRVNTKSPNIDLTQIMINVPTNTPLYGTLRYPIDLLTVASVQSVAQTHVFTVTNPMDFESNVIVPNAGLALGMIGGGALSGIGQGIGAWAQAKYGKEMKEMEIDWMRERNNQDWQQRTGMQGSMFDFQKQMNHAVYEQTKQLRSGDYGQQLLLQDKHQTFARELVGLESDAAIRRANNAQHLAGYRTGGAVAGLSALATRGGLGHPDAPKGAFLMPRSRSTQTDSPIVHMTVPTGPKSGPMSSYY